MSAPLVTFTVAVVLWLACLETGSADLVRVDLSAQKWRLTNANNSISLPTTVPAHTLSVLAEAEVITADPLYRYGERETRWVSEERWNFTLLWSSKKHELLGGCRQVLLLLHGIDTVASVVLNGRHVLHADNAHRSWWVALGADALREGANMLSVVLEPAAATAARAQAAYPYPVPTMQVPGGIPLFNWVRKPAADFGWDWGPAFVPAGVTGGVELVGFDRATLIGALVSQAFNSSSNTFDLTVTAQFVVPAGGDSGTLSLTFAVLDLHKEEQIELQPGVVAGNSLQALATMHLQVPASKVQLWQPLTLLPKGKPRELYDLAVMFEPTVQPEDATTNTRLAATCGLPPDKKSKQRGAAAGKDAGSTTTSSISVDGGDIDDSSSSSRSSTGSGGEASGFGKAPVPELRSTIVRRIGFRTVELVQEPVAAAARELLGGPQPQPQSQSQHAASAGAAAAAAVGSDSDPHDDQVLPTGAAGESFYFRVNGVPVFAKGANLIPLHVLSSAVSEGSVRALLHAAVDANMNMVRIWGGGRYQVDELYEAADELGLMVWQEAMFACSPYPRNAGFLSNVEAEVTQQLLRLGSHASLVVFGGNNEVEQSLEWYQESRDNLAMYASDYSTLFQHTVGKLVQQMLPTTPWVDSSPSKGTVLLPDTPGRQADDAGSSAHAAVASAPPAATNPPFAIGHTALSAQQMPAGGDISPGASSTVGVLEGVSRGSRVKRWGNTNDPTYGDVHFYNYRDDCQDWRTYPHARFVSEYGWQSYPSWPTYAAATAEEDWWVTADMTEYRQRHPNGTVELLAQLQRRFRLPAAWSSLLRHQPQQQQQPDLALQLPRQQVAAASAHGPASSHTARDRSGLRHVSNMFAAVWWYLQRHAKLLGLQLPLTTPAASSPPGTYADSTEGLQAGHTAAAPAGAGHVQAANGLAPGRLHSTQVPAAPGGAPAARASGMQQTTGDMQHFVYLTQLQQMLCYETALHTWRRLRSDASVLSMGVLYWQLNDVWAGASWSSIDYGGVWKPVHYGAARAFADVTLSIQHDLQEDTISVYAVNDLQESAIVQLAVRLLSLTDTPAHCHSPAAGSSSIHTSSNGDSSGTSTDYAFKAAPYVRFHKMLNAEAPAGSSVLLWSKPVAAVLKKAGQGCSRTSCYVHVALAGEGVAQQEAPVWLAPFKELPLQDPQLAVSSMARVGLTGDETTILTGSGHKQEAVAFTVSSQAVAVYALWEVQEEGGAALPGHFSNNALTIHPCEPREVTFLPQVGYYSGVVGMAGLHGEGGGSAGSTHADGEASSRGDEQQHDAGLQGGHLLKLLQEQLVVTSLWNHQQFSERGWVQERLAAV